MLQRSESNKPRLHVYRTYPITTSGFVRCTAAAEHEMCSLHSHNENEQASRVREQRLQRIIAVYGFWKGKERTLIVDVVDVGGEDLEV